MVFPSLDEHDAIATAAPGLMPGSAPPPPMPVQIPAAQVARAMLYRTPVRPPRPGSFGGAPLLAAVATLGVASGGCGSIMRGRGDVVRFDSNPQGANVYMDSRPIGATPLDKYVEHGDHDVVMAKPGYADAYTRITASFSGYSLILLPWGLLIDWANGSIYTLDDRFCAMKLVPEMAAATANVWSPGPATPAQVLDRQSDLDLPSPTLATVIGVAATVIPAKVAQLQLDRSAGYSSARDDRYFALVGGAFALGPSMGYLYAGDFSSAIWGGLGRSALVGLGLWVARSEARSEAHIPQAQRPDGIPPSMLPLLGAMGWWIVDIVRMPSAVNAKNRHAAAVALVPTLASARAPGLALGGTF